MGFLLNSYSRKSYDLSLPSQYAVLSHIEVNIESTAQPRSGRSPYIELEKERLDLVDDWIGSFLV